MGFLDFTAIRDVNEVLIVNNFLFLSFFLGFMH